MTLLLALQSNDTVERINTFAPTPDHKFVLGLPTGSSPEVVYRHLVEAFRDGRISFRNVVTFNMVTLPDMKCFSIATDQA
jgi:6-phosphogluconolactonase/glucosamine-6-phosphate isomerase/deaminase